ncbi:MAG: type III pantothenate kinase [Ignavibacteriae bacterium]|nr:type III pantothenate kinase [Ignavibacteriota bacterium]
MMNNLLIDIGNSRIKIFTGKQNSGVKALSSSKYNKRDFQSVFKKIISDIKSDFDTACVSLTNRKYRVTVKNVLKNFSPHAGILFVDTQTKIPLKLDYANTLGSDRICSSVGAFLKYGKANNFLLVIDFGTATTFNLILNGVYKGGMISAGAETILTNLSMLTALKGLKLPDNAKQINNNTPDSIKAGAFFQSLYTAVMFITEMKKKYPSLYVIATGGLAGVFSKKTNLINKVDRFLTAEGLNYIIKGI